MPRKERWIRRFLIAGQGVLLLEQPEDRFGGQLMALDQHGKTKGKGPEKGVWKSGKGKGRRHTKGRQLQDQAWDDVRALLGDRPSRADLLIDTSDLSPHVLKAEIERLCGQPAVRNILERSHQDKQGSITVKQLPSSTVGLLSRVYRPTVKLMHTESNTDSEQFVGFVSHLKKEGKTRS